MLFREPVRPWTMRGGVKYKLTPPPAEAPPSGLLCRPNKFVKYSIVRARVIYMRYYERSVLKHDSAVKLENKFTRTTTGGKTAFQRTARTQHRLSVRC